MRYYCYVLNLRALSAIDKGVQSTHAVVELFNKYTDSSDKELEQKVFTWAERDKTLILLNNGDLESMNKSYELIKTLAYELRIPFAKFNEESLGGILTSIALIVPEYVVKLNTDVILEVEPADLQLKRFLDSKRLAT